MSAGGAAFGYDALDRLLSIHSSTTPIVGFAYDGFNRIAEYQTTSSISARYVHGPGIDNPIVWYDGSAINNTTRRFLMADERGSVVSITDSAGATIRINSYDEYGIPAPGNVGRFGYTGQVWLPEVGMWYYKARMYSSTLGRFMQTDPIGYGDGMNWYGYVGGDPINRADPSGNCKTETARRSGADCGERRTARMWVAKNLFGATDEQRGIAEAVVADYLRYSATLDDVKSSLISSGLYLNRSYEFLASILLGSRQFFA